jgi:hypothetical protein
MQLDISTHVGLEPLHPCLQSFTSPQNQQEASDFPTFQNFLPWMKTVPILQVFVDVIRPSGGIEKPLKPLGKSLLLFVSIFVPEIVKVQRPTFPQRNSLLFQLTHF